MNKDIEQQINKAVEGRDLSELIRLTGLPADVITQQRVMTRKKRLDLPAWGQLEELKK